MKTTAWLTAAALLPAICGCGVSTPTVVNLVNTTDFPIDVELYYDDDQNLTEGLIELDGTEVTTTVAAGDTYSFNRDCEDLQAIFIKDAEMRVAPGLSPDASTPVFREPDDFGCGDTLVFTFTQNVTMTDLDIDYEQQ